MLNKVNEFVTESFGKENLHLTRTLYWIEKMKSDASEELRIAASSHDIERAFQSEADSSKKFNYNWGEAMEKHQVESGIIMFDFLLKAGYDPKKAERVRELVSKHEVGGDAEQNLLKDADSLSWLEISVPRHVNFIEEKGLEKEELKKKIDFMYNRITSEKAKEIAGSFYENAINLLDKVE